jgi:hypothetical protein
MNRPNRDHLNALGAEIIGCAIRVRHVLGPGLLEFTDQACVASRTDRRWTVR